jgi:glutathione S-transferase
MADLILTTFDWVREMPRGYVRDMRVPWALKEAGSRYRVESAHFVLVITGTQFVMRNTQPFGQVPRLIDEDLRERCGLLHPS